MTFAFIMMAEYLHRQVRSDLSKKKSKERNMKTDTGKRLKLKGEMSNGGSEITL